MSGTTQRPEANAAERCDLACSVVNAFNPRGISFAAKTAAAAVAAILIALWFNLPNPGWAALTVYLTSQKVGGATGAVIGRSTYRALGTLLGAAGTMFVIPAFSSAPETLIVGVAAWVGLLVCISLLDRGPQSYVFLLAAYTLPLIGLPVANNPASAFDVTLWRIEEIGLGALLAIAVHSVFAPHTIKPLLVGKSRAAVDAAKGWMLKGLGPHPIGDAERRPRERFAVDLGELYELAAYLRFEPGVAAPDIAIVSALERRLLELLPLLSGVEDRLPGIRAADASLGAQVDAHLQRVRLRLEQPLSPTDAASLGATGIDLVDAQRSAMTTGQVLAIGAMQRLSELLKSWSECLALLHRLEDGNGTADGAAHKLIEEVSLRALHTDPALAAFSGVSVALTVIVAGAVCWIVGWDQGAGAIGIAAAGSSLAAAFDDPRPLLRVLIVAGLLAIPVAGLYVFAVFPSLDGPVALTVALAPLFFFSALYLATPKLGVPALGFVLIALPLLSIQSVQTADFGSFTATAIGALMGCVIALVVASLMRVISAETSVHRLLRATWRDLAAMADGRRNLTRAVWGSRMLDRIGLMLPRLAGTSDALRAQAVRALDDLRMGVNILDLRLAAAAAQPRVRTAIQAALQQIGAHARRRLRNPDAEPEPMLLESIERAVAELIEAEPGASRLQGLTAATGLRLRFSAGDAVAANATVASGAAR